MSRVIVTLSLLLQNAMPAAGQAATISDLAVIRDIREPLPMDGLPPFTGVSLIMLAASLGLVVSRSTRKRNPADGRPPAPAVPADTLSLLRDAYERGELSADQLFEQLARQVGENLVPDFTTTMTSTEILEAADGVMPAGPIGQAAALFTLCDRVRFGGYRPDEGTVTQAISAAHKLLEQLRSLT